MAELPHFPTQGVWRSGSRGARWHVWAPAAPAVTLVTWAGSVRREHRLTQLGAGQFAGELPDVEEGLRYAYRLAEGPELPDPASRWQPDGVHQPSAVFFPDSFAWSDAAWHGVAREDLVIYELHVGTFTPEGTFAAIIPRLAELKSLGVTALEIMPVAQFPGARNWGYDGVLPYAVQNSYGGPRGFQQLVDAAHAAGLAVILDVVYNHLGPEGNYLPRFGPYFTNRYHTPWGAALNYDGPDSGPVRRYVIDNALHWVRDFHVDGLRLDAIQAMRDASPRHILAELQEAVQAEAAARNRTVQVFGETDQNEVQQVLPAARGGFGLDGVWSDDFHHSLHAWLTGQRERVFQDFGQPEQVAKAYVTPFVYDGGYSQRRRRCHGTPVGDADRTRFIVCIQNHDQVGNRARSDRWASFLPPPAQRLGCGLLLLSPCTPLLFMGEEYGETHPFPFFCSFSERSLNKAAQRGRRHEAGVEAARLGITVPAPHTAATFASARLTWAWPEGSPQAQLRALYQDLLTARRAWPPLRDRRHTTARIEYVADSRGTNQPVLVLTRGQTAQLTAVANLTAEFLPVPANLNAGRLVLTTEDARYGGERADTQTFAQLRPYELVLYGSGAWDWSSLEPSLSATMP